ncbi:hypothetical protein BHE90_010108 [Fusarium euwallaceae]|uniref:Uncharacterized protein n=1 Tax=Fusarium euwallaceae TaxID=1147111 RepID=A0A430LI64_9HYPO|nr:hypothetical protein BHE90_010108 [Fusarium euwallaceae]
MSYSSSSTPAASTGKRRRPTRAMDERQIKRTRGEVENRPQTLFFGLEFEFACPALDESIGEGGEHDYLRQCHSIHGNLASELSATGRKVAINLIVRHDRFHSKGMGEEQPPEHEVCRRRLHDTFVPGHPPNLPFPGQYDIWTEDRDEALYPVELTTPILPESKWLNGLCDFWDAISCIYDRLGGRVLVGPSFGLHVNFSFSTPARDPAGSLTRLALQRLFTLLWLLEEPLLLFLCPARETAGPPLTADRDWDRESAPPLGPDDSSEMRQNLPDNAIDYIPHAGCGFFETRAVNVRELGEEPPVALGSSRRRSSSHDLARPSLLTPPRPASPDESRDEPDHTASTLRLPGAAWNRPEPPERPPQVPSSPPSTSAPEISPDTPGRLVVEVRHAPSSIAKPFVQTWVGVILCAAKLAHHSRSAGRYCKTVEHLVDGILAASNVSGVKRAGKIVSILQMELQKVIEPGHRLALPFDEAYFQARHETYLDGRDPNLDDDQEWATTV